MNFPVVGIGASAGGLEALIELIGSLNPERELAYIIVQHLSPHHKSALTELLAAKTKLSVEEAANHVAIRPRAIYVIPANSVMTVDEGRLIITPRTLAESPPTPIDRLFESLADEEGQNAIGIVLSGTGNDGASGLRAIKNAGGLTFAQDKETAKFFGMPQAAINLDGVDLVLPPCGIAKELMKLIEHPYFIRTHSASYERDEPHQDKLLQKILIELKVRTGIDFTLYKKGTIRRRLARRLALHGMKNLDEYPAFLKASKDEAEVLSRELLIQVTDFFRDPDVFEGISHLILPHLIQERNTDLPIRVWVPGCSSGEEVYSIAITLLEFLESGIKEHDIQIFGTDLSESAIEMARAGVYPETISRHVSEERLRRFFERKNGGYRISNTVRDLCVFARQNVIDDPPFSRIDVISCRNLLIYLDPALQKRVMTLFHYALRPGGYLILGPSETVGATSELFAPIDKRLRIFSKKVLLKRNSVPLLDSPDRLTFIPSLRKGATLRGERDSDRLIREADRVASRRFVPPGILCDSELNILEYRGDTSPFLENPPGPPTNNLRKLIKPGLLVDLCNAIRTACDKRETSRHEGLRVETSAGTSYFSAEIIPINFGNEGVAWFWVFFEPAEMGKSGQLLAKQGFFASIIRLADGLFSHRVEPDANQRELARLARELESTQAYVRDLLDSHEASVEELKTAEEELLSSNEEFQSTNEELETAQEELQSSNDELRSRNRELNLINEELIFARDFSEAIVETIHQPLLVLNKDLRVHSANPAFYQVFQMKQETTEGVQFAELDQGQWTTPEILSLLEDILPSKSRIEGKEVHLHFERLGYRILRLNAQCLNWSKNQRILIAIDDITEERKAAEQLQSMDRRKDEFLAMLAHELRNPLTPIQHALEIWRSANIGPEEIKHAQNMMERQLIQETRLLDDLLDLSRISRDVITLKKEKLDLAKITQETIDDVRSGIENRHQRLDLNIPRTPVVIDGDKARWAQIVFNLLTNANKFTPRGGTISVALFREGTQAVLTVSDTGIGLDGDNIEKVFDLFMQTEKSLARTYGGLGIGLTLVRRLVEMHGGQITAFSEGLGKGSCFTIRVPALPFEPSEIISEPEQSVLPKLNLGRRILVVDDNVDAAESLCLLLTLDGHQTQSAFDGEEAIRVAATFEPEIIFLDIGLPGLDGYEVASRLREIKKTNAPFIIALSGYGQDSDFKKSKAAGFDDHLVKPADVERIRSLIATVHPSQG